MVRVTLHIQVDESKTGKEIILELEGYIQNLKSLLKLEEDKYIIQQVTIGLDR